MTLAEFTTTSLFSTFLVFCRIGSTFMFLPAIGEMYVPMTVRLVFALVVSMLIYSTSSLITEIIFPDSILATTLIISGEICIGIIFGLATKFILASLHVFGMVVASQSGLASAMMFDPSQSTQGSLFGNFLTMVATILILSMDLHLEMIDALAHSYHLLPIGNFSHHFESLMDLMMRSASSAFITGVRMSFPFLIMSLLLFIGSGVLAKLIPQIQIFTLILPAQIILNVLILLLTLSSILMWFMEHYNEQLIQIFGI